MPALLTRDQFREQTLARHGGRCCIPSCDQPATDAHHILNRNLFHGPTEHGGYFLDNGANLCGPHHLDAERTLITVEDLRRHCGITTPVLPEHLADDTAYDTWGNPVLDATTRLAGELFTDAGCQSALTAGGVLWQVSPYVKYPRTFHLPWSPGASADDKVQHDLSALTGHDVVVTLKMDGEATTIYPDGHSHARSLTAKAHPSRDHIRALAATISGDIPPGHRISGENLYATHSIEYTDLDAHFLVYSIWHADRCLSWDETTEWAELLDLPCVPVLHRGPMPTQAALTDLFAPHQDTHEGYVVRPTGTFTLAQFPTRVLKWVRPAHVTTDQHWMSGPVRVNGLRSHTPGPS